MNQYYDGLKLSHYYVPENTARKCLVLDGQQRLQSLFIGLRGSYNKRELYFNILSGELAAPDDVKYKFAFIERNKASFPWVNFKDLVFSDQDALSLAMEYIDKYKANLTDEDQKKISKHISIVFKTFHSDDGISYQELDNTENTSLYTEDDVVEIFIRANSGGTKLDKSDLLFALLKSSWDEATDKIEQLQEQISKKGFEFSQDFILKACLTVLDKGAQYEVSKMRKPDVKEAIEAKWDKISNSVLEVIDFVSGRTYIRCQKALPSTLILIPLIYSNYHFRDNWKQATGIDDYLLFGSIGGVMSGSSDQLIDSMVSDIKKNNGFNLESIFSVIHNSGRSTDITKDRFWQMGYGSKLIHLIFNVWYKSFDYVPAYQDNYPQIDHIFPQSALQKIKSVNPKTGHKKIIKYKKEDRNQLANCMLLTKAENSAKKDTLPEIWFKDKDESYLNMHMIPTDKELWKLDRFDDFIQARKDLIEKTFTFILKK